MIKSADPTLDPITQPFTLKPQDSLTLGLLRTAVRIPSDQPLDPLTVGLLRTTVRILDEYVGLLRTLNLFFVGLLRRL